MKLIKFTLLVLLIGTLLSCTPTSYEVERQRRVIVSYDPVTLMCIARWSTENPTTSHKSVISTEMCKLLALTEG